MANDSSVFSTRSFSQSAINGPAARSALRPSSTAAVIRRAALSLALLVVPSSNAQAPGNASVIQLFSQNHRQMVVIAHRGCHEAAPLHGFGHAPENSLLALEHCVAMGVDMMETDIHMTADGYLVIMHDDNVDRTTNGHGKVEDLTLSELRNLRLRQNLGGYSEALTDQRVMTLDEILDAAKGRITLYLDVKGPIYAEVVEAVMKAGATNLVTVKTRTGIGSPKLSLIEPFERVPFIPILDARGSSLVEVAARQTGGAKPVALELPHMSAADLPQIAELARHEHVKLFINTLGDGFVDGHPGDNDAERDPDAVWGWLYRNGVGSIQTDRIELLLRFRQRLH